MNYRDPYGEDVADYDWDWLYNTSDFLAGFGDTISGDLTAMLRDALYDDDFTDKCSGWYKGGTYTGYAYDVAMMAAMAAEMASAAAAGKAAARKAGKAVAPKKPGVRRQNRLPDKGSPNTTEFSQPGTSGKRYGPDGHVQKEFNRGHQGSKTPKVERGITFTT